MVMFVTQREDQFQNGKSRDVFEKAWASVYACSDVEERRFSAASSAWA